MPEVAPPASVMPSFPAVTPPPPPGFTATVGVLSSTTLLPWEEEHMQVHTILIIVIFCVVCLLLLLAFFYAFCFHCSLGPSPKDPDSTNRVSLDREDATYRCSSPDKESVGNVV